MDKKIRTIGMALLIAVWVSVTALCWFAPAKEISESERRPLAQLPEISLNSLSSGKFMEIFEDYTLDQFPLRDSFRTLKSLFHYYVLQQTDNNDIYLEGQYAAKLEYPLNQVSVNRALSLFNKINDQYLQGTDCNVYLSVIPDKGYFLTRENGYPAMDYARLFSQMQTQMPWAQYVDITGNLTVEDYYRTDTHWRQEKLVDIADKLCAAMGVQAAGEETYTPHTLDRPFYGVYYGQAALPLPAEEITILESDLLSGCTVYNHETGKTGTVYDMNKLTSPDLYDVYLSGAQALLTIENPNAKTDRELVVFRDSYGSSLVPLGSRLAVPLNCMPI